MKGQFHSIMQTHQMPLGRYTYMKQRKVDQPSKQKEMLCLVMLVLAQFVLSIGTISLNNCK